MKNFFVKSVVLGAILMTSLSASAQIDLGNLGKVVSSAIGGEAGSIISSKNNVSKENIVNVTNETIFIVHLPRICKVRFAKHGK